MEQRTFKELAHRIDDLAPLIRRADDAAIRERGSEAGQRSLDALWKEVEGIQSVMLRRSPKDLQELYAQMCIYATDLVQCILPEWVLEGDAAKQKEREATPEGISTALASALHRLAAWGYQFPSPAYAEFNGVDHLKPAPLLP